MEWLKCYCFDRRKLSYYWRWISNKASISSPYKYHSTITSLSRLTNPILLGPVMVKTFAYPNTLFHVTSELKLIIIISVQSNDGKPSFYFIIFFFYDLYVKLVFLIFVHTKQVWCCEKGIHCHRASAAWARCSRPPLMRKESTWQLFICCRTWSYNWLGAISWNFMSRAVGDAWKLVGIFPHDELFWRM